MTSAGRTWHYRHFYGHPDAEPTEDLPLWLVVGNCQAEALRLVLQATVDRPFRTVRMPPVHELTAQDLPRLDTLLRRADVLLCQPIRDDYRELPLGTAQLTERLQKSARLLRWPVIRYCGLYPFQAIVRRPSDRSVTPPVVPYHDLRTVAAARAGRTPTDPWDVEVTATQIRAAGEASRAALAHREARATDVAVSDTFLAAGSDACHTINHPGNPVLHGLGSRILDALGVASPIGRLTTTLLGSIYAPLERRVLDAYGLPLDAVRHRWRTETATIAPDDVHATQLHWYADNPDFIDLTVERHGATMTLLGLLP